MNPTPEPAKTAIGSPLPDLERLVSAISHTTRWKMLREFCAGEPRTIAEMAKVAGCSYDNASKHLAMLRKAGVVVQGRGRLNELAKQYLPVPGQPVVDFGHCLLRLDKAAE
jgi:DNA-binding transcriptional ArsR family regulator